MLSTILNFLNLVYLVVTIVGGIVLYKKYKEYKKKFEEDRKASITNYINNNLDMSCVNKEKIIDCVISKTDLSIGSLISNVTSGDNEIQANFQTCKSQFNC